MRYFLVYMLLASGFVYAEEPFPYQCKSLAVSKGTVMLPGSLHSLVMIHNISDMDLWITHPISNPNASAGWSSRLQAKKWSSFALGEKEFELSCIESKPGHEQQVPCEGALTICQWVGVSTQDKQSTPYWAGENMTLTELIGHLSQRGFKLPEANKSE